MAFTGQLGVAEARPGNLQLGVLGEPDTPPSPPAPPAGAGQRSVSFEVHTSDVSLEA